eukprot:g2745.t1
MAHSSGSTGGTENNNSLQQLISPQELNDRFNEVISMVRGERNRTELDVNEYVVSKESTYWDDFCKTAHLPPSKVDANEYKDFLLNCGDTLRKIGEPLAASELYYLEYIKRYSLSAGSNNSDKEKKEQKVAIAASRKDILRYVLVVYGKSECDKELLLQNDSSLVFKKTIQNFLNILNDLRKAMDVCLNLGKMYKGSDSLYWLVHDGCVLLANICDSLVVAGYGSQVVEFYVWCILSLEVFVELSTVKYLAFHVSLYIRCCQAYDSCNNIAHALRCAKRGLKKVNQLATEEAMDPPVPEQVLNKLSMCRADLASLIFKYESMTKMFSHLEKISSGEEEALEPIGQIDPREPVEENDDGEAVEGVKNYFSLNEFGQSYLDMCKSCYTEHLKGVGGGSSNGEENGGNDEDISGEQNIVTDNIIIQGLLEASHGNSLRILKPSLDEKILTYRSTSVRIIMSMIGSQLRDELIRFREQKSFTEPPCENIITLQWHVGLARAACGTGSTWFEASVVVKSLLARLIWEPEDEELDGTEAPPYMDPNNILVNLGNKTEMEKDLIYEIQLLDAFLELEHSDECEMAVYVPPKPIKVEENEEGEDTTAKENEEAVNTTTNAPTKASPSFRIAGRQFPVQKLEAYSNALMSMVTNGDLNVLTTRKDLIGDATLTLWSPYCDAMLHAIDDVLEENLPIDKRLVNVLLNVLTTIHVSFDRCDVDDPVLRGRVCLRLVLLLEQEGELRDAVQIIRHGVKTLEKHKASRWNAANIVPYDNKERDGLSMSSISMIVEKELFESGLSNENGYKRVYGLGSLLEPLDQDLGALHVDLTMAMYRLELALGSDIAVKAKKHKARLKLIKERELAKNKAAGGAYQPPEKTTTIKAPAEEDNASDEELDEEEANKNVYLPASPQTESRLSNDCKKNLYGRALLMLCIGRRKSKNEIKKI